MVRLIHGLSWPGTVTTTGDFGEANLDIQLMMGLLGPDQELLLYQIGEQNAQQDPRKVPSGKLYQYRLTRHVTVDEFAAAFDASFCELDAVSGESRQYHLLVSCFILRSDWQSLRIVVTSPRRTLYRSRTISTRISMRTISPPSSNASAGSSARRVFLAVSTINNSDKASLLCSLL